MQSILDSAVAETGFRETHSTPHPEIIIGSAYGMAQAVGWVYRGNVYFAPANGEPDQIVSTFERVSVRALESEALRCEPIADNWIIDALAMRTSTGSALKRIVAIGRNGEASILFEADAISDEAMGQIESAALGRTLRRVLDSLQTASVSNATEDA
jgi:hypothetical protein